MESIKIVSIKMVIILMIPAKLATLSLPSWRHNFCSGVISKILSRDSNYVEDMVMWPNFGNSSISMRFYKDFTRKTNFFEGWSWLKFNNLGLGLSMALKFYTSVAKVLKVKVKKLLRLIPMLVEFTREKLIGGFFAPPPPYPE